MVCLKLLIHIDTVLCRIIYPGLCINVIAETTFIQQVKLTRGRRAKLMKGEEQLKADVSFTIFILQ